MQFTKKWTCALTFNAAAKSFSSFSVRHEPDSLSRMRLGIIHKWEFNWEYLLSNILHIILFEGNNHVKCNKRLQNRLILRATVEVLCSRHGMKILESNNGPFYEVDLINNFGHVLNPISRFPVKFRCAIFAKSTRPKNPSLNPKIFSVKDSHQFTVSHFHNFTTL